MIKEKRKEEKVRDDKDLTGKLKVERSPVLTKVYLECGTAM